MIPGKAYEYIDGTIILCCLITGSTFSGLVLRVGTMSDNWMAKGHYYETFALKAKWKEIGDDHRNKFISDLSIMQ